MLKKGLHPGRLTWNLPIPHLERKMIFQTIIFRFHVNLPGCKAMKSKSKRTYLWSTQSVSPRLSWSKFGRENKKPSENSHDWLEHPNFNRKYIFIHGQFSIVMLVFFGGNCVTCWVFSGKILGDLQEKFWAKQHFGPNLLFCGLVTFNGGLKSKGSVTRKSTETFRNGEK